MKLRITAMSAALLCSTSVFSAVTLSLPEEINMVAVNGQEVKSSLFRSNQNYKLNAGQNSISVRYTDYFEHHDNSHDILKSGVVTIQTPELTDGQNYRLALINPPKDFSQAQEYKEQPTIGLYDAKNQLLVQQEGALGLAKSWFGSAMLAKTVDLTETRAPVSQPTPIYTQAAVVPVVAKVESSSMLNNKSTTVDVALIQLWQKASKSERQKFMSWLAEQ